MDGQGVLDGRGAGAEEGPNQAPPVSDAGTRALRHALRH
eukprot:COSAG03_NODE_18166_length_360_cov_1.241379_1_plen_38_part_10